MGSKESGAKYDIAQFNDHINNQNCEVLLASGESKKVQSIISSGDTVSWIVPSQKSVSIPKSIISQIQPDLLGHHNEKIITLKSGLTKKVNAIVSSGDSISWMEPTLITEKVPASQIVKIIFVNHSRGFVEGLWKGLIAGPAAFAVIYLPSMGDHDSELIGTVVGTLIGGGIILTSPIVHGGFGHTEEYKFLK